MNVNVTVNTTVRLVITTKRKGRRVFQSVQAIRETPLDHEAIGRAVGTAIEQLRKRGGNAKADEYAFILKFT